MSEQSTPKAPDDKPAPTHHVVRPQTGGLGARDPRTPPKPSS